MKKLLSVLLVFVLLLSLAPMTIASEEVSSEPETIEAPRTDEPAGAAEEDNSEEATVESAEMQEGNASEAEPVSEPEETPLEEPAIDGPAADGAESVSGTQYASQLTDGMSLSLTGATTLIVDRCLTLEYISGDQELKIVVEDGNILTVKNPDGYAITVRALEVEGTGALSLSASEAGISTDGNIDVTGVSLGVTAGSGGVYSQNGSISLDCTAHISTARGCAIFAPWGPVTLSGDITATTSDTEAACVQSGDIRQTIIHRGQIFLKGGTFGLSANGRGIYSQLGKIDITGDLKVTSYRNTAIFTDTLSGATGFSPQAITINRATIEADGNEYGIYCAGEMIIMNSRVASAGAVCGIYTGEGFTMDSWLSVMTPAGGRISGKTVVDADGAPALGVLITKNSFTVGFDTCGRGTTPAAQTVRFGETAEEPAKPTADGCSFLGWYTDPECTKRFDFSTPIGTDITLYAKWGNIKDSVSVGITEPAYGEYPDADAKPSYTAHFTIPAQYWCTGADLSTRMTGTFAYGKTYYYYALLKPVEGWQFSADIAAADITVRIGSKTAHPVSVNRLSGSSEGWLQILVPWKLDYPDNALIFEGGSLPVPGEELDTMETTTLTCNLGRVTGLTWRVNGKQASGIAQADTTYTAAILVDKYFDDGVPSAVWNGVEATNSVRINGRGRVFEFDFATPTAHIGDATGDDEEDGYDAAVILQYCVGLAKIEPENMARADADGVYGVTPADAAWVLKYKT